MPTITDPRAFLEHLFSVAVDAADPEKVLAANLPEKPKGRTVVIGAGKGAAQMARAFERLWDAPLTGVVVTRYGYAVPCERIEVLEAAHPVPDDSEAQRARRIDSWRTNAPPPGDAFPGDPRGIEEARDEPAELTPLGRRLLGVDAWN